MGKQTPRTPETRPRWTGGIWSGSTATAQRLAIALAAVHAARPQAIRELTLDDIDLPNRRITLAGHWQPLGARQAPTGRHLSRTYPA